MAKQATPKYIPLAQFCEERVSDRTGRRWIADGRLKAVQFLNAASVSLSMGSPVRHKASGDIGPDAARDLERRITNPNNIIRFVSRSTNVTISALLIVVAALPSQRVRPRHPHAPSSGRWSPMSAGNLPMRPTSCGRCSGSPKSPGTSTRRVIAWSHRGPCSCVIGPCCARHPTHWRLPAIVQDDASLNSIYVNAGASGSGEGANKAEIFTWPDTSVFELGDGEQRLADVFVPITVASGEGIAALFTENRSVPGTTQGARSRSRSVSGRPHGSTSMR